MQAYLDNSAGESEENAEVFVSLGSSVRGSVMNMMAVLMAVGN